MSTTVIDCRSSLALLALVFQNTALAIVLNLTFRPDAPPYAPSSAVLSTELVKLLISCAVIGSSSNVELWRVIVQLKRNRLLFVPSLLYVVQNNLLFFAAKRLTPIVYIVCTQTKLLTTATMSRFILGTVLTTSQCGYLILLLFGIVMVQVQGQTLSVTSEENWGVSDQFLGVMAVLSAAWTSGTAGVVLEKIFKARTNNHDASDDTTIWTRNAQLSLISLPFAVSGVFLSDYEKVSSGSIFKGYDIFVWSVILLQAAGGIIIAFVMKFSNNMLKCFAVAISICCCALYSVATETLTFTPSLALGMLLVIISVTGFTSKPKTPTPTDHLPVHK